MIYWLLRIPHKVNRCRLLLLAFVEFDTKEFYSIGEVYDLSDGIKKTNTKKTTLDDFPLFSLCCFF